MKPKGLYDPRTGYEPWACVQLRQENMMADAFGMVGFQNHLRYGEQERVLKLIPGLANAEFLQFGQIHRNTFINSPKIINETLATRLNTRLFFAGQITGVEGYVESVATGWMAGINAVLVSRDQPMITAPQTSAIGALGETAYGYGSSDTDMESGTGVTSWKRSVQRSNGSAENGSASAGGFSASFVKIRTGDGRYYMFKGYASTGASVGPGGSSTSQTGLAKSVGGRY
jgi:hypothetical protein